MKLYINNKFLELNNNVETIKKLDYYFPDRAWVIKQLKEELAKIEKLENNVKNALDSITEMQELSLKKVKLLEDMKHAILKEHKIRVYNFKFRV